MVVVVILRLKSWPSNVILRPLVSTAALRLLISKIAVLHHAVTIAVLCFIIRSLLRILSDG